VTAALEVIEHSAKTLVLDMEAATESGPGERLALVVEGLEHRGGQRCGRVVSMLGDLEVRHRSCRQDEVERVRAGRGTVLHREGELAVGAREVEVRVAEGVEVGGSTEGLSRLGCGAVLARVVDQYHRTVVLTLQASEEAEQSRHLCAAVFIPRMNPDQGIEQEQVRPDVCHRGEQTLLVGLAVDSQRVGSDEEDLQPGEIDPVMGAE
jgi:hypothetical protein